MKDYVDADRTAQQVIDLADKARASLEIILDNIKSGMFDRTDYLLADATRDLSAAKRIFDNYTSGTRKIKTNHILINQAQIILTVVMNEKVFVEKLAEVFSNIYERLDSSTANAD